MSGGRGRFAAAAATALAVFAGATGANAATVVKTWAFATTAEGYTATTATGQISAAFDGAVGNPAGSLAMTNGAKSLTASNYWEWTGTFEAMGVPVGATVTDVQLTGGFTRCTVYTNGTTGNFAGPWELRNTDGTTVLATLYSGRSFSTSDGAWVAATGSQVSLGSLASNTTVKVRLNNTLATNCTGGCSSSVRLHDDQVSLTVTYTAGNTPPTIQINNPVNGGTIGGPAASYTIDGTASDSDGTVTAVDVQIQRGSEYWNGSIWTGSATWLPATGTTSWSYSWSWTNDMDATSVTVRARATDNGTAQTTATNTTTVDTRAPQIATPVAFQTLPTSGAANFTLSSAWTEANPGTPQFSYFLNAAGYTGFANGTSGNSSTYSPSPAVPLTGSDWFQGIRSRHTDTWSNVSAISENTGPFYVLPLTPNAPNVANNTTTDSLDLSIVPNPGEGGTGMLYAIQCNTAGGFLTAGHACGGPELFQTLAAWGTIVVTGLSQNTTYQFSVAAGNPKDASPTAGERSRSAYSATGSATTSPSSNTPPTVTITAPADPSSFNEAVSVNFTGTASDTEDGDLTASLSWTSSLDGSIGSGGSFSISTLSVGTHTITAAVTDSGSATGQDQISVTINNVAPTVTITSPGDGTTHNQGDPVNFAASATDPNDGSIAGSLSWTSSVDSPPDIGSGASFSTSTLSPGSHTITAQVTDPDDGVTTVQDQISITINAKPVVSITSPTGGADFLVGTSISFAGTAADAEDGTLTASLAWTSSINGSIGSGGSFSNSTLSIGTHTITASVTDSGGATGLAQLTITVSPPGNTSPSVTITSPADSASFTAGDTVNFTGTATDAEEGTLTANLSWTSSLQGTLGSGGSFSRNDLAVGTHVITASVTDSLGATGQDQVTITVNAPAAVNGTTAGTATAEASSCSQITVVARFTGDDDDDGFSTFTIAPSGTGCATVRGASPRRCIVSELTPGAYTLSVSFTDPDGVTGSPVTPTGSPVTVPACNGTDDAAPTLLVLAPMRDAVVTGTDRAKIQVYEPNLSTVEWMVDSSNDLDLAAATLNANYDCGADCAVYEFDLDTSGLSLGAHYFAVKATDTEGNVARITRAFRKPTSPGDSRLLRRTRGSQLCIDCHNLPTHSSQSTDSGYGNWAIECVDCHTPHQTSNIYLIRGQIETPNSGRRPVRFESTPGAVANSTTPGSASYANEDNATETDGPCQVCHTRTKSSGGNARWRNSASGGNVDTHYGNGVATNRCVNCHAHSAGFSGAGGACNACHVAPPDVGKHRLHDEVWDSTAGNLPTAYDENVTHATATEYGFACAECHSNDTNDHFPVSDPAPYDVDVLFKGTAPSNPSGSYTPDAGSVTVDPGNNGDGWNWSNGTCSNLYCHSNANPTGTGASSTTATVTWDQVTAVTCVSCHNTQGRTDSGNAAHLSSAHGKHIQSTSGETNTYAFKCDECHALTIRDNPNDPWNLTRAADFSSVAGRGKLQHVDGGKDVAFSATATAADSVDQSGGSYAGGSCSDTYCHSRGTTTTAPFTGPFASLQWSTGTSSCESCHGGNAGATNKMATNAHTAHMNQSSYLGKNFECAQCHDDTLDLGSDTTIADRGFHVNGARNVNINKGGTYSAPNCSNVYCHSKGTEDLVADTTDYQNPPAWNSGTTLANTCKSCHGTEAGSIAGEPRYANNQGAFKTRNTHPRHVTAATDCVKCHSGTVNASGGLLSAGNHLNQARDVTVTGFILSYNEGTETCTNQCHGGAGNPVTWGGNSLVCLDCHTGTESTNVLGDGAPNAVDDEWTTTGANGAGHGHASYGNFARTDGTNPSAYGGCDYCHDLGVAHAPTVSGNPYRLRFSATNNSLCLQCHSVGDTGISANSAGATLNTINSTKNILDTSSTTTGHFGAKHQTGEGGNLCWDCHDPHGVPSNILMVKTMVSITSDTYGVPTKTPADIAPTPGPGVSFTARAAAGDFVKQIDSAYGGTPRAGICQACHEPGKTGNPLSDNAASTKYWRWDGSDDDLNQADNSFRLNSAHNKTLKCTQCHFHDANFKGAGGDCLGCHGLSGGAGTTGPNSRRPVRDDFGKNSHHVGASVDAAGNPLFTQPTMGGALTNFDCVVCHAEGKLVADSVATGACISAGNPSACCTGPGTGTCQTTDTDGQPHQDAIINLRNTDSATAYYNYNKGAITGASNTWMSGNSNWQTQTSQALDPFCLSCHDFDGASATFNSGVNENRGFTGSTSNPFADSAVANEYDQVNRVSVVNIRNKVDSYRNDANALITPVDRDQSGEARGPDGRADPTQGIYSRHAIRGDGSSFGSVSVYQADSNTSCTAAGTPYTCCTGSGTGTCEGIPNNRWVARPVGTTGSWNDNSVMGCADCHTTDGANTTNGNAHGSNTEYLLKSSDGSATTEPSFDIRNVSTPGINCYKCHARAWYSRDQRNLEHTDNSGDWAFTADQTGSANRRASNGNVFGLPCMTCHGGTDFGRIHGTSETLLINAGPATRKTYRFTNGASQRYFDPNNWTTTSFTCYTLTNAQAVADSWGGCAQHDQGGSGATYTRLAPRPLKY